MKVIANKLWTEPAYFLGAIAVVGATALQIVNLPDYVEIPLTALLVGGAAKGTRDRVVPLAKLGPAPEQVDPSAGNVRKPRA